MTIHAGSIYVAGAFKSSGTEYKALLRKYDSSGVELWTQQIPATDNAFPDAVAADASGVYIAMSVGSDRREPQLHKYAVDGRKVWSRQLRFSQNGHHYAIAGLAIDDLGIYIAAWDGLSQGIVRRYSLSGTKLWTRTMPATLMRGVVTDGGGVYVATRNNSEAFVIKFASTGSLVWTRSLTQSEQEINMPAAVAAARSVCTSVARCIDAPKPRGQRTFMKVGKLMRRNLIVMALPCGVVDSARREQELSLSQLTARNL